MAAPETARREESRENAVIASEQSASKTKQQKGSAVPRLLLQFDKESTLRLVGAPLGAVLEHLLDGETCPFDPAPEPTLRELIDFHATTEKVTPEDVQLAELKPPAAEVWADYLGLQADYDAPEGGEWNEKGRFQSLVFPQGLAKRLDRVLQDYERSDRESDGEELFLSFGALERGEGEAAEAVPLLMLSVRLLRSPEGPIMETLGGRPFVNPELAGLFGAAAEKLAAASGGDELQGFLERAAGISSDWTLRRYLTLFEAPLLPIWAAQDAGRGDWKIGETPAALSGEGGQKIEEAAFASAEDIDNQLEPVVPLDDAQSRVVLAALEGRSLLTLGLPKNGKTQTAVALAAEALSRGNRVLYLSARRASLKDFSRRLNEAGLGDAQLPLYGQADAESDLAGRVAGLLAADRSFESPKELAALREAQAGRREALWAYRKAAGSKLGKLDLTAAQILHEAGRLKLMHPKLLPLLPRAKGFDPLEIDEAARRSAKEKLLAVESMVARVSAKQPLANHPWAGVSALSLAKSKNRKDVLEQLKKARAAFEKVGQEATLLVQTFRLSLELDEQFLLDIKALAQEGDGIEAARPRVETAIEVTRRIFDKLYLKTSNEAAAIIAIPQMMALAKEAPEAVGLVPRTLLTDPYLDEQLAEIEPQLSMLLEARSLIETTFDLEGARALGGERLCEMAKILRRRKFFSFSDKERRQARKQLRKIRRLKGRSTSRLMPDLLEETARFFDNEVAFFSESSHTDLLGEDLDSADYWMKALQEGRGWVLKVERTFGEGFGRRTQIGPALLTLEFAELTELAEGEQDPKTADLIWLRDRLLASGQDWDYAKGAVWKAYLGTLVSPAAAEALAKLQVVESRSLVRRCGEVARQIAAFEEVWRSFQTKTELRASLWDPRTKPTLKERLKRMDHALANGDSLAEWIELMALLNEDKRPGVTEVMKALVVGSLPKAAACDLYDLLLFEGLMKAVLEKLPALARFATKEGGDLRSGYLDTERRLAGLHVQEIAAKHASKVTAAGKALKPIEKRLAKGGDATSPANLLDEEFEALTTLAPCLAMTPAAASRWLPRREGLFDLLIVDDASLLAATELEQLSRRASTLLAMADPSRAFFADAGDALEKLLAALPSIHLERHYGDVSAELASVQSTLGPDMPFRALPRPAGREEEGGLVAFEGRSDSETLVKAIEAQLTGRSGLSFGVVSVSAGQREAVAEKLAILIEEKSELASALAGPEGGAESFFLRTLAEYRGEERDLIFLLLGDEIEPLADLQASAIAGLPLRARRELRVFNGIEADLLAEGPDLSAAVYLSKLLAASKEGGAAAHPESAQLLVDALKSKALAAEEGPEPGSILLGGGFWIDHDDLAASEPPSETPSLREREVFLPALLEALGWRCSVLSCLRWCADPSGERDRLEKAARAAAAMEGPLREKQA